MRPPLRVATHFLLVFLFAALCHAETCDGGATFPPGQQPTITSVSPNPWPAGSTFTVVVTGIFPDNGNPALLPGCDYTEIYVTIPPGGDNYSGGSDYSYLDGGVTYVIQSSGGVLITNIVWVSTSQTSFTLTVPAGTTGETASINIGNDAGYEAIGTVPIGCPAPTIATVTPSIWFAGKTYNSVKITGTNFVTTDKATAACPVTPVNIAAADGSAVPVSGVKVDSKTQITVTGVAPPADDPTETATVTAGTAPNTAAYTTAQILGNQIQCDPSLGCTQSVISTTDGSAPPVQSAVVGQPIILTTPVLPSGITATKTAWTVGATNIGGYVVAPDVSSAAVTPTVLNAASLNTYWVYPQAGIPVTYQYCVNIPSVGNQCSLVANASFNVTGPTATITPTPSSWSVSPQMACPTTVQFLYFGYPDPASGCNLVPLVKGISFQAALSSVPDGGGTTEWVQLIRKNALSGTLLSGGKAGPTSYGVGLDNSYPYPPDDPNDAVTTMASDSPDNSLSPTLARETRRFKADMYYLWQPQISGSIFVPLGYVEWSTSGTAVQNTSDLPPWSLASSGASTAVFKVSSDTGYAHGYPTWANLVLNNSTTSQMNDDDELEEQQ